MCVTRNTRTLIATSFLTLLPNFDFHFQLYLQFQLQFQNVKKDYIFFFKVITLQDTRYKYLFQVGT